jgi:hypothetical protein
MVIGSGDRVINFYESLGVSSPDKTTENLYFVSDKKIYFYTNNQGDADSGPIKASLVLERDGRAYSMAGFISNKTLTCHGLMVVIIILKFEIEMEPREKLRFGRVLPRIMQVNLDDVLLWEFIRKMLQREINILIE